VSTVTAHAQRLAHDVTARLLRDRRRAGTGTTSRSRSRASRRSRRSGPVPGD